MLGHNHGPSLEEEDGPLRLRVIRIHINDWRASTLGLSCEEEGFFWRFNLLLYDRMGVLTDDDAVNCRSMNMDIRSYRRLRQRLIDLGKIRIEEGRLSHPRIIREIEMYIAEYKKRSLAARIREKKRREEERLQAQSPELQPEIAHRSDEDQPEVGPISAGLPSELSPLKSENDNEINGCAATTVAQADQSLARAPVPKPKPKPKEELKGESVVNQLPLVDADQNPGLPTEKGIDPVVPAFERFWELFPSGRKRRKGQTRDLFRQIVTGKHKKRRTDIGTVLEAVRRYAESQPDPDYVPMPETWLNGGSWEDDVGEPKAPKAWWEDRSVVAEITLDRWRSGISTYANGHWPVDRLGPPPGHPECVVPQALMKELRLTEIYTDGGIKR